MGEKSGLNRKSERVFVYFYFTEKGYLVLYKKPLKSIAIVILAGMCHLGFRWSCYSEEVFQEIVITPGDTLWSISNKYLKDPKKWSDIVKHNPAMNADPTVPMAGTRIKIPITLIKEEFQNARLIKFIPDVEYQRKNNSSWAQVNSNMLLYYEDSIRTLANGQAQVKFPSNEIIQINENSYVILRPEKILQEIQLIKGIFELLRRR